MRKAFTLIELLVIVAILGAMVTAGTLTFSTGRKAARLKGATRDLFAAMRYARSVALVSGQPSVVTYSNETADDDPMAQIKVDGAKLMDAGISRANVQTLSGEPLKSAKDAEPVVAEGTTESGQGGGETVADVLFAPVSTEILKGMRLKVLVGDETLDTNVDTEKQKAKVSIFSTVDYLKNQHKTWQEQQKEKEAAESTETATTTSTVTTDTEATPPVTIVWETNGRVDPHTVWIYADGDRPEKGLCIKVDRFGGMKVLSGDGREED